MLERLFLGDWHFVWSDLNLLKTETGAPLTCPLSALARAGNINLKWQCHTTFWSKFCFSFWKLGRFTFFKHVLILLFNSLFVSRIGFRCCVVIILKLLVISQNCKILFYVRLGWKWLTVAHTLVTATTKLYVQFEGQKYLKAFLFMSFFIIYSLEI